MSEQNTTPDAMSGGAPAAPASRKDDIHAAYETARQKREALIKKKQELARRHHEELMKTRSRRVLWSSVLMVIILSVIMILYPTPLVSAISILLICIFFCVGVTYQRAITLLLIITGGSILVIQSFYFIFQQ